MPSENFYRAILKQHGIEFALCDAERRVYEFSPGLVRYVRPVSGPLRGQRLEDLFDELMGFEPDLQAIQAGTQPALKIEKVYRQFLDHQTGYITFSVASFSPGLMVLVTDVTAEGLLEQRVTQQRNELDLLAGRLVQARTQLDDLLHRFVPTAVADQIVNDPLSVQLGGERREVSVLFADMRGFTSLSEVQTPERLLDLLNDCFRTMGYSLIGYGGTISQYAGDMIMAIFNAPLSQSDHAQRAVQAALDLQAMLQTVHSQGSGGSDLPKIDFGVSINTGLAVVGYLGFEQRFEYTAIGETVNVASRFSSLAKGGQILVGEATYWAVRDRFLTNSLGLMHVKGKHQPVAAYEIVGMA